MVNNSFARLLFIPRIRQTAGGLLSSITDCFFMERNMPAARQRLSLALFLCLSALLGACAPSYDYRPLALSPAVDCGAVPGKLSGYEYWLLGETGGRMIWTGCDKAGADLRARNLATANLEGTDLRGAQLQGADLGAANARGADLSDADLSGADVTAIYWYGAVLRRANLTGLDLTGVEMEAVDLSGALWIDGKTRCGLDSLGYCNP